MIKKCAVCGTEFYAPPSSKKITCGKECSAIRKRTTHMGKSNVWNEKSRSKLRGKYTDNLKKGTPAATKSPNSGRFETNVNAKRWHIKSPEGVEYRFRSMMNWARKNCGLFGFETSDKNALKIATAFSNLKSCMLGKSKNRMQTYKDWIIILDDDTEI